jgi:WD40 repeat protein
MNTIHSLARMTLVLCLLLFICILPGCVLPTAPTPWPTRTPRPSLTPSVTSTAVPTLTPTGTPVVAALSGTAIPESGAILAVADLPHLALLAEWGLGQPQQVRWSPDGTRIAVAATSGLAIYRSADLTIERILRPGLTLRSLAYSPDGSELAAGVESGLILRWNTADGSPLPALTGGSAGSAAGSAAVPLSLAYSPDGSRLAAGGWDNRVRIWKLAEPTQPAVLDAELAPIRTIAFSADGSELYTWNHLDQMLTFEVETGKAGRKVYTGINTAGGSAAFSSQAPGAAGDSAIAVEQNTRVRVTRIADSTISFEILTGFAKPIQSIALAGDQKTVATLEEGSLRLWNGSQALAAYPLTAAPAAITMDFAPDGKSLALVGDRLSLYTAFSDKTAQPRSADLPDYQPCSPLASHLAGNVLVTAQDGGLGQYVTLQIRSLSGGEPDSVVSLSGKSANIVTLSDDLKLGALGSMDGTLTLFDVATGTVANTIKKAHSQSITAAAFSPAGDALATGSSDGTIDVWDPATGAVLKKLNLSSLAAARRDTTAPISRLTYSPDGKWLTAGAGGNTLLYSTGDWTLSKTLSGSSAVFSPAGDLLALATAKETRATVTLYALPGFQTTRSFPVQGSRFAFTPIGSLLAVSGPDLAFYRVADGTLVASLASPAPHGRIEISARGDLIVLTAWDGVVSVIGIPPQGK